MTSPRLRTHRTTQARTAARPLKAHRPATAARRDLGENVAGVFQAATFGARHRALLGFSCDHTGQDIRRCEKEFGRRGGNVSRNVGRRRHQAREGSLPHQHRSGRMSRRRLRFQVVNLFALCNALGSLCCARRASGPWCRQQCLRGVASIIFWFSAGCRKKWRAKEALALFFWPKNLL